MPPKTPRLAALDRARGLIMLVMALDHASLFIAHRHSAEYWGGAWTRYDSAAAFLTRFVTHFCAPGFFLWMGAGLALLAASRTAAGWSGRRIAIFVAKRGALLILLNHLVENWAWLLGGVTSHPGPQMDPVPGTGPAIFMAFTVLTGLGLSLLAAAPLLTLRDHWWWLAAFASLAISALFTPPPADAALPHSLLLTFAMLPGQSAHAILMYPLLPWFGITAAGVLLGRWLARDSASVFRAAPWLGAALLAAALVLRMGGGFGNLRPPRDAGWIEFLNFIKYPPSLVFTLFTAGVNLLLVAALARINARVGDVLAVFGQAPLAYYIVHLYLYAIVGVLFFRTVDVNFAVLYAVWLAGLVPLYFFCARYREFKRSQPPESLWRFL